MTDTQGKYTDLGNSLSNIGMLALRLSVVLVLVWIGAMKFTAYEAGAIEGLVHSSPLISWLYSVLSVQGASNFIGATEILTGALLLLGLRSPVAGVAGAVLAAGTFALTLTFLFSAPGWEASLGGFPALSVVPGQFLLKDAVLLAAAIFLAGDSLKKMSA